MPLHFDLYAWGNYFSVQQILCCSIIERHGECLVLSHRLLYAITFRLQSTGWPNDRKTCELCYQLRPTDSELDFWLTSHSYSAMYWRHFACDGRCFSELQTLHCFYFYSASLQLFRMHLRSQWQLEGIVPNLRLAIWLSIRAATVFISSPSFGLSNLGLERLRL